MTAVEHHDAAHGEHTEHSDFYYAKIALFLAVVTGAEVALSYMDVGALFLPILFILMIIKFVVVVLFFMHLRFDSKIFGFLFWTGLVLALGVYIATLATMKFFVG